MQFPYGMCLIVSWSLIAFPASGSAYDEKSDQQKKAATELWKTLLAKDNPEFVETEHFLLIGSVDEKAMDKVGKAVEKHLPLVLKNLLFEEEDDKFKLWEGKVTVHLCKDRAEFRSLYTKMKRERPLDDEMSTYHHEGVTTHVLVGPPSVGKSPLPLEIEVVGQLGAATLTRKRTARLPPWFVTGYARSQAYRFSPKAFGKERQVALALLAQGKKIGDLYAENDLAPAAVAVLRGSFVDFLAHSPQMKPYWQKFLGKIDDQIPLDQLWDQLRIKGEDVQQAWMVWARAPR